MKQSLRTAKKFHGRATHRKRSPASVGHCVKATRGYDLYGKCSNRTGRAEDKIVVPAPEDQKSLPEISITVNQ
ncbi:hypothetical protein B9Z55_028152 [Caenorhabditis nigoni]|uniref:Uncharacterized protein n=1 Tax=Caenorhabditis nigoni TaxID=1611254 RepID=A0A2G5SCX6_9PELO|nr:hypothetical protein B9Z55_028152 [Caenorhabditis nigoni]